MTIAGHLVEMSGLEPPTPTLSGWCSNLLSYISAFGGEQLQRIKLLVENISDDKSSGGEYRIRTDDPLLARQVL